MTYRDGPLSAFELAVSDAMTAERIAQGKEARHIAEQSALSLATVKVVESGHRGASLRFVEEYLGALGLRPRIVFERIAQDHPDFNKEKKAGEERLGTAKDLDP